MLCFCLVYFVLIFYDIRWISVARWSQELRLLRTSTLLLSYRWSHVVLYSVGTNNFNGRAIRTQLRCLQPLCIEDPCARIRSHASESNPAARDHPAPVTASNHPQLDPHPGCAPGVKPAALLPRHAMAPSPLHPRPLPHSVSSQPLPCPNISSPLQDLSDRCNISCILLKHTCIVIATSR